MKKRLRKKLHRGEFQEFGFCVSFDLVPGLTVQERNHVLDEFIDMIEQHGLEFGGGGARDTWEGFVALDSRGTATETHRAAVREWLQTQAKISAVRIGELRDAWYGWN